MSAFAVGVWSCVSDVRAFNEGANERSLAMVAVRIDQICQPRVVEQPFLATPMSE